ncbi:Fc.00g088320.m01.CDS01 [Cosmosporella sp. VM-42]
MSGSQSTVFPWECRDREDLAKAAYHHPLRRANQSLTDENMRLKRILRDNGISWSPIALAHLKQINPTQRKTRSSMTSQDLGKPHLPMEILLKILKSAMQSPFPIIDPLSPSRPENLSEKEKARGNQIAINFLVTSRAMYDQGTRYLWESNDFTFTTPQAVRAFTDLPLRFRQRITHVNFRIIARYYDDQQRRHKLDHCYHADLKKDHRLKVQQRPVETPLIRGGFRCYTWNQIIDFLKGLRAPFDPTVKLRKAPRPRLLENLASLRLDLVNFSDTLLPFSGSELHDIASHEFGCTLNELQITGMPFDDTGMKASAELSGMLKDEGLYLDGPASYVAHTRFLQPLSGKKWCARVIRAWKPKDHSGDDTSGEDTPDAQQRAHSHVKLGALPPAPAEEGHPPSSRDEETVIWKRVPTSRDESEREWIQFSRFSGYEMNDLDLDSDDEGICPCCGESHPGSSFLEFLMDEDMAD